MCAYTYFGDTALVTAKSWCDSQHAFSGNTIDQHIKIKTHLGYVRVPQMAWCVTKNLEKNYPFVCLQTIIPEILPNVVCTEYAKSSSELTNFNYFDEMFQKSASLSCL